MANILISSSDILFNAGEIIDHVRDKLVGYIVLISGGLATIILGILFGIVLPSVFYVRGFGLIFSIAGICFIFWIFTLGCRGFYVAYRWRVGIKDKTIVKNITKDGKIGEAVIVGMEKGKISFKYEVKGVERESSFNTVYWDKCKVGDKIRVVYIYNIFSFPL